MTSFCESFITQVEALDVSPEELITGLILGILFGSQHEQVLIELHPIFDFLMRLISSYLDMELTMFIKLTRLLAMRYSAMGMCIGRIVEKTIKVIVRMDC